MKISEVNIYPIKSLKGIGVTGSVVEKRGLRYDRRWMLTELDGMFITQREVPKMATISPEVTSDGLRVTSADAGAIAIPFEPDRGRRQQVTIFGAEVAAETYDGPVSEWFSDALSKKCQLVRMPESSERHVSEKFDRGGDVVSFADGYPLLIIGEASLGELNDRVRQARSEEEQESFVPYPMKRFRPNLVVQGTEPFEEDGWAKIRVGEMVFRVPRPCARCVIPTVDPECGEFDGKDPLKTMATFRMAKDAFPATFEELAHAPNNVLFGENLIPETAGSTVRCGDEVTVLDKRR